MKLKDIFEIEKIDDEQFMVCLDNNVFCGMIQLNETAAFIVNILKNETTPAKIVQLVIKEYDVDENLASEGVNGIIQQLTSINALE